MRSLPAESQGRSQVPGHMIPPRQVPNDDDGYFEQMTKAIFRSGFSWKVIENKWPHFVEAFDRFSVERVAAYNVVDIERLLSDEGIVRNGRKVEATVWNARKILTVRAEYGSFRGYLDAMQEMDYPEVSKQLQSDFEHLGRTGAYVFLYTVGEEVPGWEDR